ncbi:MAG: hypothetical protein KDE58_37030 [Caldilineaceae bacterium]|nr:hypothetical protein [Caldilineaceae bacterium]
MTLVLVRDRITYELSTICTFELCITGQLPTHIMTEPNALEQLLEHLEQAQFFENTTNILRQHTPLEQESENDDEAFATDDDEVPF